MRKDGFGKCARLLSAVAGIVLLGSGCPTAAGLTSSPGKLAADPSVTPSAMDTAGLQSQIDNLASGLAATDSTVQGLTSQLSALSSQVAGVVSQPAPAPAPAPVPVPTSFTTKLAVRDRGHFDQQQFPDRWDIKVYQINANGRLGSNTVYEGRTDANGVVNVTVANSDFTSALYVVATNNAISSTAQVLHTIVPFRVVEAALAVAAEVDGDELAGWSVIDPASDEIAKNLVLAAAAFDLGIDPARIVPDAFSTFIQSVRNLADVKSCLKNNDCTSAIILLAMRNNEAVLNDALHTLPWIASPSVVLAGGNLNQGDPLSGDDNLGGDEVITGDGVVTTNGGDGETGLTNSLCGMGMTNAVLVNGNTFGNTSGSRTFKVNVDNDPDRGSAGEHDALFNDTATSKVLDVFTWAIRSQNGLEDVEINNQFHRSCSVNEALSILNSSTGESKTVKIEAATQIEKSVLFGGSEKGCIVETSSNTLSSDSTTEDGIDYHNVVIGSSDEWVIVCQEVGSACEPSEIVNGKTISTFDDSENCLGFKLPGFHDEALNDHLAFEVVNSGSVVTSGEIDTIRAKLTANKVLALNGDQAWFRWNIVAASDNATNKTNHPGLVPVRLATDCKANVALGGPEGVLMNPEAWGADTFLARDAVRLALASECFVGTAKASHFVSEVMAANLLNGTMNVQNNVGIPAGYLIPGTLYRVRKLPTGSTNLSGILFKARTDPRGGWMGAVPGLVAGDKLDFQASQDDDKMHFQFDVL